MKAFVKLLLTVVLSLTTCMVADAAQVNWLGSSGGDWNDVVNWSSAPFLPTFTDDVRVDCPGIISITHSLGTADINSLYCAENLDLTGGFLSVAAPSQVSQAFTLNGGSLIADGLFTCSGSSAWYSGTIAGWAGVSNSGWFYISGSSSKTLNGSVFTNGGTVTHTGSSIAFLSSSLLENHGLYDLQASALEAQGASGQIDNFGTLRKSVYSGTANIMLPFNNIGGNVDVWTGQLGLRGGGSSTGGQISISSRASLAFGGTHTFSGDVSVSGAGYATLESGTFTVGPSGSVDFSLYGQSQSPGLQLHGAALVCNGPVRNSGSAGWYSGAISGWGGFSNSGLLTIMSGGATLSNGVLNNSGTVSSLPSVYLMAPAVVNNLAGGVYDVLSGPPFSGSAGSGNSQINNYGAFRKSVSTVTADIAFPFNNLGGSVEVSAGRLGLRGGGNSTGGAIAVSNHGSVAFSGAHILAGALTASGSGSVILDNSTFTINPGASLVSTVTGTLTGEGLILSGAIQANGPITNAGVGSWSGATIKGRGGLTNTGSLSIATQGGTLDGSILNNSGTASQLGGSIALTGSSSISNAVNGLFDLQSGTIVATGLKPGKLTNSGVFRKSTPGTAALFAPFDNIGGTIDVREGALMLAGGGFCTGGIILLGDGARIQYSGNHTLAGTLDVSGKGSLAVDGGSFDTQPGSIINVSNPDSIFEVNAGRAGGAGVIDLAGDFNLHQNAALVTEIVDSHTFGKVHISDCAYIDGNLEVATPSGYAFKAGDRFPVLAYTTRQGYFAHIISPALPDNLELDLEYSDTDVTLVVTGKPSRKPLPSIAAARFEGLGTGVSVSGVVTAVFSDCFYLEDGNRAAAIRVQGKLPPHPQPLMPNVDDPITADGVLAVLDGSLTLTDATWTAGPSIDPVSPLFVTTRALGGSALGLQPGVKDGTGLCNIGLLVTIAGRITYSAAGLAYLDDGSGLSDGNTLGDGGSTVLGVKIILPPETTLSTDHAVLTGISCVDTASGVPVRALRVLE